MNWSRLDYVLTSVPLWTVAVGLFGSMAAAAYIALQVRQRRERSRPLTKEEIEESKTPEAYIVSAVLGLLALLLGFTFSLAVDRFDARRGLVRQEATAIGTVYFRAQLLAQPNRERTSALLSQYLDNRIVLARASNKQRPELLAKNDALINDIWAASASALDDIKCYDWSSTYLDSVSEILALDASRKAARVARVPAEVFLVLFIYMVTTAAVLGYVLRGKGGRISAGFLLALLSLTLVMIIDIDGPLGGAVFESQRPMELLQTRIATYSPSVFQKWRSVEPGKPSAGSCSGSPSAPPSPDVQKFLSR